MLSRWQTAYLRAQAHGRKPVVRVGQGGPTDAVVAELEHTFEAHELVKIRLAGGDRTTRAAWITELCERTGTQTVQQIGATASLFRRNPERPRITLPEH